MTLPQPNVRNVLKANGITYNVMAYRKLSPQEMILSVRHYRSTNKRKKIRPGDSVYIFTLFQ